MMEVISTFSVIDFGYLDADAAARWDAMLARKGSPIGLINTLIAGICTSTNETLITRNARHFQRIKDLKVEVW